MRTLFVLVFASLAAAPVAGAATPTRDCSTRAEGPGPVTRLVRPGDLQLGPVAFMGLGRAGDPKEFGRLATRVRGRYLLKMPLAVRAGRVVNVSVAPVGDFRVGLTFAHRSSLAGVPRVRFRACDRDEPAFSYPGKVGPVTVFAGGVSLTERGCVAIRVSARGDRRYSATVPFGTGGCGLARLRTL